MRHLIERLHPGAAAVTTTRGGPAEPWRASNLYRFAPYYASLARKAVSKVSQKVGVPILPAVVRFDPAPLQGRRALLRSLGEGRMPAAEDFRSASLFPRDALQTLLRDAAELPRMDIVVLGRVVSIELALRAVGATVEA